jgi:hypothetical protein
MASTQDPSRRYSDEEVRRLLERASELESQEASLPARREGLTLAELEAIAGEAGIDPQLLRQAALELDSSGDPGLPAPGRASGLLGAPLSLHLQRVFPAEAPNGILELLLPPIQRAADGMGQPSLVGQTLTWQSTDSQKGRVLQVSASVGGGKTRLDIEESYGTMAGNLFGGIIGGVGGGVGLGVGLGVGIGALGSALFATVFPLAVIGGSYAVARAAFRGTVHGRMRTLTRLMEEMAGIVGDSLEEEPPRLEKGG